MEARCGCARLTARAAPSRSSCPPDLTFPFMALVNAFLAALQAAFFMFWDVLWPLALGFLLSAVVQAVVSRGAVVRVLGRADLKGFAFACGFGAASSSCSYAAVALARSLFRKGADFTNAMIFEFAS